MSPAAARFHASVVRLTGAAPDPTHRLGLAVSGGPDSMAMLALAHAAFPNAIAAVTVDHRLRPEAADEADMVARHCAALGVPHITLHPVEPIAGSIQAAARAARYALLEQWRAASRIGWIATAHHADDQLETLLMRLARGSGAAGLAGIRAVNGAVIRPLLDVTKAELVAICRETGTPFAEDPSNADPDFDRVRVRQALAGFDLVPPAAASRSAAALADADAALGWMAERLAAERISGDDEALILDPANLPRELRRRLLLVALRRVQPGLDPRGEAQDRALAVLAAGETLTIGEVLCKGGARWRFTVAPPRRAG